MTAEKAKLVVQMIDSLATGRGLIIEGNIINRFMEMFEPVIGQGPKWEELSRKLGDLNVATQLIESHMADTKVMLIQVLADESSEVLDPLEQNKQAAGDESSAQA